MPCLSPSLGHVQTPMLCLLETGHTFVPPRPALTQLLAHAAGAEAEAQRLQEGVAQLMAGRDAADERHRVSARTLQGSSKGPGLGPLCNRPF